MKDFLQFLLIGIGLGSAYSLFAQGAVLIYRGSGIVNFGHGAVGMFASYITFRTTYQLQGWPIGVCIVLGIAAAVAVGLLFQLLVLQGIGPLAAKPKQALWAIVGVASLVQLFTEEGRDKTLVAALVWLAAAVAVAMFVKTIVGPRLGDKAKGVNTAVLSVLAVATIIYLGNIGYGRLLATVLCGALLIGFLDLPGLKTAAPIIRLIATLGLLGVLQAGVELRYRSANVPVDPFLPHKIFDWGGVRVQEQRIYMFAITLLLTIGLWALTRYTRIGLAITASAQNERAVQTLGWSPQLLGSFTWGLGSALAGVAAILVAPDTGLSTIGFTQVVTIAALAAALLGGFRSFPMTLVGGMVVGVGESIVGLYKAEIQDFFHQDNITGLNRAGPFLIILLVLVVRGRGLPLRSHISDRLPKLGTGVINWRAMAVPLVIILGLLFTVFDDNWAAAVYISMSGAVIVLSVVVLTGYAGQLSLGQWTMAGIGALIGASFIYRLHWPMELAIVAGVLLAIPVGLLFALPALRTRGVNLAVVTLALGFAVGEILFRNGRWLGSVFDAGTRIGPAKLFGIKVDTITHPHRYAVVCLIAFVLSGLLVANLRRSRTGRRLVAVRTNERAAASLGISVFSVKLYAFAVAAALAALGGILVGFKESVVTYEKFGVFDSINAVSFAVIGGVGWVIGAVMSAPNAIGGIGTRMMEDLVNIGQWDKLVGGAILLLIIKANQDGAAAVAAEAMRPLFKKLRLVKDRPAHAPLPEVVTETVAPVTLEVKGLTVRFGGVTAVREVSFKVNPGEVVGLIGPNGAGKTTVIDAVTGFVKPASGELSLNGERIDAWPANKRARHGLRRSFQSLELFEDISVEDNIRAGADADNTTTASWVTDLFWPKTHDLTSTSVAAIKEFELEPHLDQLPGELPYGRRRLVGIARAVANGPSIIMLDEPAAGLDEAESRDLAHLIRRLAKERQMGVLLVEHDVGLVMTTCDRIVVIEFGQVIAEGTPDEIRNSPVVRAAYLGTAHDEGDGDGAGGDPAAKNGQSENVKVEVGS